MKLITMLLLFSISSFASIEKACDDYDKIAAVIEPYSEQAWTGISATPSGPVPTITFFTVSMRQPILDFCRYVKTMQRLDTIGQVSSTADYANKLTGGIYNEDINFLQETLSLGSAVNNHFAKGDKDRRNDMAIHRKLNRYLRVQEQYFKNDKNNQEDQFETRDRRESKMQRMVRNSNRISGIDKVSRCKQGELTPSEDEIKEYEENIFPLYQIVEENEDEVVYHLNQLQTMGVKFNVGYQDFKDYQAKLLNLISNGVVYTRSNTKYEYKDTYKLGKPEKIKARYYDYSIQINSKLFENFLKLYSDKWISFVDYEVTQTSRGLLNDPRSRVNNQFRELSHECRRSKIEWQVRRSNPQLKFQERGNANFDRAVETKIATCKSGLKTPANKAVNLFNTYVNALRFHLVAQKQTEAKIWGYESKNMGNHRSVASVQTSTEVGDITTEKVACDSPLNFTESTRGKLEAQASIIESREMIAEEMMTKTLMMENEALRRKKEEQKTREQRMIDSELKKRRQGSGTYSIEMGEL